MTSILRPIDGAHRKVLVLGGDGFCGWPTSLYLSRIGYDVTIVDDLSRRGIDRTLGTDSLTPIRPIGERLAAWEAVAGRRIRFVELRVGEAYAAFRDLVAEIGPDTIVHFAEQRSAPFSMRSAREKRLTVEGNVCATHDVVCALAETGLDAHLVHLGSVGVYGYGSTGFPRPEGYLKVAAQAPGGTVEKEILYPADPESIYHLTKALDQLVLQYYAKNDRLRITDLHQGIVWGTQTEETARDERLINRFDYDGDYGTVINRFLVQAALGYPLTVHGSGRQTRAFIHIRDTVRCVALAIGDPPRRGERVRILNQVTETHRVIDLARMIARLSGTPFQHVANPRLEPEENELDVSNRGLIGLGLVPTHLEDALLAEISAIAGRYAHRCDRATIPSRTRWCAAPEPSPIAPGAGAAPSPGSAARTCAEPASPSTECALAGGAAPAPPLPQADADELEAGPPQEAWYDPEIAAPEPARL